MLVKNTCSLNAPKQTSAALIYVKACYLYHLSDVNVVTSPRWLHTDCTQAPRPMPVAQCTHMSKTWAWFAFIRGTSIAENYRGKTAAVTLSTCLPLFSDGILLWPPLIVKHMRAKAFYTFARSIESHGSEHPVHFLSFTIINTHASLYRKVTVQINPRSNRPFPRYINDNSSTPLATLLTSTCTTWCLCLYTRRMQPCRRHTPSLLGALAVKRPSTAFHEKGIGMVGGCRSQAPVSVCEGLQTCTQFQASLAASDDKPLALITSGWPAPQARSEGKWRNHASLFTRRH